MSMLHRVEKFEDHDRDAPLLLLSFETEYRGYWQCWSDGLNIAPAKDEPDVEMLTREEQEAVQKLSPLIWRMVYPHK